MPFWQKLIFEFLLAKFKKIYRWKDLSTSALKEPFFSCSEVSFSFFFKMKIKCYFSIEIFVILVDTSFIFVFQRTLHRLLAVTHLFFYSVNVK